MPNRIENISCPSCTRPLMTVEWFDAEQRTVLHSFGCRTIVEPIAERPHWLHTLLICPACGTRTLGPDIPDVVSEPPPKA